MEIEILVATHKKVNMKLPEYCHLIQVGSSLHEKIAGYLYDDACGGDGGISEKNDSYCELTALYYLWKQSDADIKGLFQYRRILSNEKPLTCNSCRPRKRANSLDMVCITEAQIKNYLMSNDAIVEVPYYPGFWTGREDLEKFCYPTDIDKLENVIQTYYPEYTDEFMSVMASRHLYYCNMLITGRDYLDKYCEWLFGVLDKCEDVIDISSYDREHKRVFGYFAEILMNVYLQHHSARLAYVPMIYVFEYKGESKIPMWVRWEKERIIQVLGRLHIALPNISTKRIQEYNRWLQKTECDHISRSIKDSA